MWDVVFLYACVNYINIQIFKCQCSDSTELLNKQGVIQSISDIKTWVKLSKKFFTFTLRQIQSLIRSAISIGLLVNVESENRKRFKNIFSKGISMSFYKQIDWWLGWGTQTTKTPNVHCIKMYITLCIK